MEFKQYLITESKNYIGKRVSDIQNAIEDLVENGKNIGTRALVKASQGIINQIRRLLHTHWEDEEKEDLKVVQKVGVNLAKAIEEKDDLLQVLTSAKNEIDNLMGKLKVPVRQLSKPKEGEESPPEENQEPAPPVE